MLNENLFETRPAQDFQSTIIIQQLSGSRLDRDFLQNFGRNFSERNTELKHRRLGAAPPTANFPVGADEFHIGMRAEVQHERSFSRIKLLPECRDGLRLPGCAVSRSEDRYIERLLLDDLRDGKCGEKYAAGSSAQVNARTVSLGRGDGAH